MRSGFLKKNFKNIGSVALALAVTAGVAAGGLHGILPAHADSAKKFSYDEVDPVEIKVVSPSNNESITVTPKENIASTITNQTVVYTGNFYYMESVERDENVVEYAVEILGTGEQRIAAKHTGSGGNEIPVPGYLISIPASKSGADGYSVGDIVELDGAETPIWPEYTADNLTDHVRVAISYLNMSVRNAPGIVYYGPEFGTDTKQNQWGAELNAELDSTDGKFHVKEFRGLGVGSDKVGIDIPLMGFALSSYVASANSEPWRAMLAKDVVFSEGDIISLSGYDYLGLDMNVTRYFNYLDPTDDDNPTGAGYGENRGTNQLNIYTKSVDTGGSEMNTNSWGFEAAVNAEGVVTSMATNVIYIPDGGFVVSGHGTSGDWIKSYVKVGATITYDNALKTLNVSTSQKSFLTTMQNKLAAFENQAKLYETRLYDLNFEALNAAVADYKKIVEDATELDKTIAAATDDGTKFLHQVEFKGLTNRATAAENAILMQLTQSNIVEGRAAWHRPNVLGLETNLQQIIDNLTILSECGINTLYVEMLWDGYASFKSELVTYNPSLAKYTYGDYPDFFTAYIKEAKKLGIEVHAWVENFFVGSTTDDKTPVENQAGFKGSIIGKHPEWAQYTRTGSLIQPYEISGSAHYVFIDPANPEVRKFLLDFYEELYTKFPEMVGLNLDYIRYPTCYGGTDVPEIDSGYTGYAMDDFLKTYGYGIPHSTEVDTFRKQFVAALENDKQMEKDWHAYRVELITSFVKEVREMTDRVRPDAIISTSTVPDYDEAIETKMQDWRTWVRNGWIDLCTPMSYYLSSESVESNASQMILIIDDIAYSYVGLGAYMGFQPVDFVQQIGACYNARATGYSLFETSTVLLHKDVQEVLKATVSSKKSVIASASAHDVLEAVFDDILKKADRIYLPKNAMTEAQKTELSARFDTLLAMPMEKAEDLVALYKELNKLSNEMGTYTKGWGEVRTKELLSDALNNIDIKISRAYIHEKLWDPSAGETRPDKVTTSQPPKPSDGTQKPPVTQEPTEPKKGCGSAVTGICGLVVCGFGLAALAVRKKRK
ncbi:MAG: family 10 glycosylhydrolase [Clostridia bacterium]|nr:family 10 glycosylhydrolase [Clostridia bacterium]